VLAVASPARISFDQHLDGDAVGEEQHFAAARRRTRKQFERVAAVGRVFGSVTLRISRHARQGGPPARYFGLRASRSGVGLSEEPSIRSMPGMLPDKRAFAREGYRNSSGQRARAFASYERTPSDGRAPMLDRV
jgi:hypothetical protein